MNTAREISFVGVFENRVYSELLDYVNTGVFKVICWDTSDGEVSSVVHRRHWGLYQKSFLQTIQEGIAKASYRMLRAANSVLGTWFTATFLRTNRPLPHVNFPKTDLMTWDQWTKQDIREGGMPFIDLDHECPTVIPTIAAAA
jgi:hypothetical protein